ncbi:formate dehydrogenase accessory protein FdhE [Desulfobaculum bizertense]|uniref:FdhE protein n=1 Tax=Desulfobaculum bizertense DSM 18034 TaxID=1121442 RepID=A0A1T4WND8_9BACT|nr:formate dehydrogenase accessory protein FdhE [Desulfobaculum bizertense]SKA78862.1 FdhE protein [Desulfobaculum bizertense DSM 18034]
MTFDPEAQLRRLQSRLAKLRKSQHIPSELIDLVEAVHTRQIRAQAEAKITLPETVSSPERVQAGVPLVSREDFPFDSEQAGTLFSEFLTLLSKSVAPMQQAVTTIQKALDSGELRTEQAFSAHLKADEDFFALWAEKTPEAPRVINFLAQSSLAPSLAAAAEALSSHTDLTLAQNHGHCPICGSLPYITDLHDKEGFRYASCSFCNSEYRIPRLSCAFCGEQDTQKLSYFKAEEEKGYRVDVCDSCHHYIKCSDFRDLDKKALHLVDDLESLSLDILAAKEGYTRPTLSALGF